MGGRGRTCSTPAPAADLAAAAAGATAVVPICPHSFTPLDHAGHTCSAFVCTCSRSSALICLHVCALVPPFICACLFGFHLYLSMLVLSLFGLVWPSFALFHVHSCVLVLWAFIHTHLCLFWAHLALICTCSCVSCLFTLVLHLFGPVHICFGLIWLSLALIHACLCLVGLICLYQIHS